MGLQRTYIQYGTTGENMHATDEVKIEYDSSGEEQLYIHEKGGLLIENISQYKVTSSEVRLIYVINAFNNNEVNELDLANKNEWKTGDGDNSVSYLTRTGLNIEVPAGIFKDSIEVTNITNIESEEKTSVNYYAPVVGLIKTVFINTGGKHVFSELESSNADILTQESSSNRNKINDKNIESKEQKQTANTEKSSLGGTSQLLLSDYTKRVNELSLEQLEYYILHRPEFKELDTGDYVYKFSVLQGELSILTNQDGMIRNLTWDSELPMTDETLLNIQSLILGLNPSITIEEVNEFLFSGNDKIVFAEFKVNLSSSPDSFLFEININ